MKIKLYGTGAITSKSLSACALIDDTILFDCPNGLVKKLRQENIDFNKIQTIIISHFHADHDYDLTFLLWEYNRANRKDPLTIIAPKGFAERHKILSNMAWTGMYTFEKMISNVNPNILEASDGKTFECGNYKIKAVKVKHANCDAYGYKIQNGKNIATFTGDAAMCDNIDKLIENSNIAFIDITAPINPEALKDIHIDIPQFETLAKQYPNCNLIPIHMNDDTRAKLKEMGYNPPHDNKEYII